MKLELDGLTKEFGDFTAVNHINLTMTNGVYGLLGVNGAGKTTLMRMLCTLLKPTSGTICCNGKDIFSMDSEYRKLLGYLPQDFGFYPEFTVEDYFASMKKAETLYGVLTDILDTCSQYYEKRVLPLSCRKHHGKMSCISQMNTSDLMIFQVSAPCCILQIVSMFSPARAGLRPSPISSEIGT